MKTQSLHARLQNLGTVRICLLAKYNQSLMHYKATDIEKALTISKDGDQVQEWLEVGNGCICCSVK